MSVRLPAVTLTLGGQPGPTTGLTIPVIVEATPGLTALGVRPTGAFNVPWTLLLAIVGLVLAAGLLGAGIARAFK